MLTLQLRTAQRELLELESAERGLDESITREQLRAKLEPLEAQRRQALDDALDDARREAAAAVATARDRADALRREIEESQPVVEPVTVAAAPIVIAPLAADDEPPVTAAFATPPPPMVPAPVAPQIVFDSEAFARVFATVLAETIEQTRCEMLQQMQHSQQHGQALFVPPVQYSPGQPFGQYPLYYPPRQPETKGGFWSHAKHPDVVLLGIATIIVLAILGAWLS